MKLGVSCLKRSVWENTWEIDYLCLCRHRKQSGNNMPQHNSLACRCCSGFLVQVHEMKLEEERTEKDLGQSPHPLSSCHDDLEWWLSHSVISVGSVLYPGWLEKEKWVVPRLSCRFVIVRKIRHLMWRYGIYGNYIILRWWQNSIYKIFCRDYEVRYDLPAHQFERMNIFYCFIIHVAKHSQDSPKNLYIIMPLR